MTTSPPVPLRVAMAFATEAERRGIAYAIGGALALGVWGYPRGTLDLDLNVFVEPDQLDDTFDALEAIGVTVDRAAGRARAERDGMFIAQLDGMQIDVFTPSISFSREAERTRQRVEIEPLGQAADFLSAEAIAVFKLLFFRGKDRVDLERLVAAQPSLDGAYVRTHLVDMVGEDDPRVAFWDEQLRRFRGPAA